MHPVQQAETTPQRWELFRLLSEPIRLRLLGVAADEELSIGELADVLGESQPNVSRHVAALGRAGLVALRREGTRAIVTSVVNMGKGGDVVVQDAIASGRAMCERDGSLKRVDGVIRARDAIARDYFDRESAPQKNGKPESFAFGAYLAALAPLVERRALAVDAGTGDGSMLEVLSPIFDRVIGIDRSETQLAMARARVKHHALANVTLVRGELDSNEVLRVAEKKADAVFAVRVLHHAPKPAAVLAKLAGLCRPGGNVIVLDYARHDDERMREQADLWLGFADAELKKLARSAGLHNARISTLPARLTGSGPDAHLLWKMMVLTTQEKKHG
jgi:ArsR family transcriptional regulator